MTYWDEPFPEEMDPTCPVTHRACASRTDCRALGVCKRLPSPPEPERGADLYDARVLRDAQTEEQTMRRTDDPIQPYDSDHTALVHVLWDARRDGVTIEDADELASRIMRSRWMQAVQVHAVEKDQTRDSGAATDG